MTALDKDQLEQYVDAHGVDDLLRTLEDICYEKAQHIEEDWQDQALAKSWERAAKSIGKVSVTYLP